MTAVAEFIGAMEAAGVYPMEPIEHRLGQGGLIRFRSDGDKPGRRNAWAVLHLDGTPAGAFGSYRLRVAATWRADRVERLSPGQLRVQREQWRKAAAERAAEIERQQAAASAYAVERWNAAQPADPDHPYLLRKRMTPAGLRQIGDRLLVPMLDITGKLWNLQRINPAGLKLFLKGGRTGGLFWPLGKPGRTIGIGEGVATVAAVHRATGHAVVAAFSEKNLCDVAKIVRATFPAADIVLLADDDAHLAEDPRIRRNVGIEAARAAAAAVSGRVAIPGRAG
jgi:putative DNA primase/helicase